MFESHQFGYSPEVVIEIFKGCVVFEFLTVTDQNRKYVISAAAMLIFIYNLLNTRLYTYPDQLPRLGPAVSDLPPGYVIPFQTRNIYK